MSYGTFNYNGVSYISTAPTSFYEDECGEEKSGCKGCALYERPYSLCFASQEEYNCTEHQIIWKIKEETNAQDK